MSKKVLMILAEGFEEAEAVIVFDVLKRLGFDVTLAGLGAKKIESTHGVLIESCCLLEEFRPKDFDAVILPGGMPGSSNLRNSEKVTDFVKAVSDKGGIAAAICAAPIALQKAGVVNGKKITAYPGFENMLQGAEYTGNRTEKDGNIVTGKGPGAAFEFAAEVAKALGKTESEIETLFGGMFVKI